MSKFLELKCIISKMISNQQIGLGINNKKLAKYLNITQHRVINIINCEENISIDIISKIEIILNIKIF